MNPTYARFGIAIAVIVLGLGCMAYIGVQQSKSYYVQIKDLRSLGNDAYERHLRVAGNVQPGSIHTRGTNADFVLEEKGQLLNVSYKGAEPPPDTFKDSAVALVVGEYGKDGVFHANQIQAKCASKYKAQAEQQAAGATAPAPQAVPAAQAQPKGY
ncbi:MAG TPA: cytochrome c maturation protein CcmE [Candidatus Angelobacter sp.]|jgi:cytochrome c-type biogenesis protein CcmE|nr:cytochrome c maturation protein CcmE [Candidatus Angelobacter sp.]